MRKISSGNVTEKKKTKEKKGKEKRLRVTGGKKLDEKQIFVENNYPCRVDRVLSFPGASMLNKLTSNRYLDPTTQNG